MSNCENCRWRDAKELVKKVIIEGYSDTDAKLEFHKMVDTYFNNDRKKVNEFIKACLPSETYSSVIPNLSILYPADILWYILTSTGMNRVILLSKLGYSPKYISKWCACSSNKFNDDDLIKDFYLMNKERDSSVKVAKDIMSFIPARIQDNYINQREVLNRQCSLEAVCIFNLSNDSVITTFDMFSARSIEIESVFVNRLSWIVGNGKKLVFKDANGVEHTAEFTGDGLFYSFVVSSLLTRYGLTDMYNECYYSNDWKKYNWDDTVEKRSDGAIIIFPKGLRSKDREALSRYVNAAIDDMKSRGMPVNGVLFDISNGSIYDLPLEEAKNYLDHLKKVNNANYAEYADLRSLLEDLSEEEWDEVRKNAKDAMFGFGDE